MGPANDPASQVVHGLGNDEELMGKKGRNFTILCTDHPCRTATGSKSLDRATLQLHLDRFVDATAVPRLGQRRLMRSQSI